jgi:hypothetical protein
VASFVLAAGAAPALAANQVGSNAFSELTSGGNEASTSTATTATTPTRANGTETGSSSNSAKLILIAIAAAVVLLSAIGFVIVRDARRVAPVTEGELLDARGGNAAAAAARLRRRRAKAKAARQQRKRNR